MWTVKLGLVFFLFHQSLPVKLHNLREMHFAELKPVNQNVTIAIRLDEKKFYVRSSLDFYPVDNSISSIPLRAPSFYNRKIYLTAEGEKMILPHAYHRTYILFDYFNQFFSENIAYRLSISAERDLDYGKYGLQYRDYTDRSTKQDGLYFFTNVFPNNVHFMVPTTTTKRQKYINYFIKFQKTYQYISTNEITNEGMFTIENACMNEVIMVIISIIISKRYDRFFQVIAKPDENNKFPAYLVPFADIAYEVFKRNDKFLGIPFFPVHQGLKVVLLPDLNIKPIVLGREVCLIDEDVVLSQPELRVYLMTVCMVNQYFSNSLTAYSEEIYYIDNGLREFYSIIELPNSEELISEHMHAVLHAERNPGLGLRLIDYWGDMKVALKIYHAKKSVGFFSTLRSSSSDKKMFDILISRFMFEGTDFTLHSFTEILRQRASTFNFASDFNIDAIFLSWSNSTGYPLLYLSVKGNNLHLKIKVTSKDPNTYFIFPFKIIFPESNKKPIIQWINSATNYIFSLEGKKRYYLVNEGHRALMRVNYDNNNWLKLIENFHTLSAFDKGATISDAYYFATRNELPLEYVFLLMKQLKNETSPATWRAVEHVIIDMGRRFRFSPVHLRYKIFLRKISQKFYNTFKEHKSGLAVMIACLAGYSRCLKESRDMVLNFLIRDIEQDHREYILCAGMRTMDEDFYDYIGKAISNKTIRNQRVILMAMTCQENRKLIFKFLSHIIIRNEYAINLRFKLKLLINTFMASEMGLQEFWYLFDVQNMIIYNKFTRKQFHRLIYMFSRYLKTRNHYRTMKRILIRHNLSQNRVLNNIADNMLFIDNYKKIMFEVMLD